MVFATPTSSLSLLLQRGYAPYLDVLRPSPLDQLLGPVYTWMVGSWDAAVARNRALLDLLGLAAWPRGTAVDLDCGSGFQSLPLADAGFNALALDLCAPLLAELGTRTGDQWYLAVSSYCKLRLNAVQVGALLTAAGLTLEHSATDQGAVRFVGLQR